MRQHIRGTIRLTRYREYVAFVVVTTLLGTIAGSGYFGWPLLGVLAANLLAVGFAFMINDVEDAADDALDSSKVQRNPVSSGALSRRLAYAAAGGVALASGGLYALLGRGPLIAGVACLALGFLYSWRPVRLKAIPFADLVSHALMLAGLQYVAAYATFETQPGLRFFLPLSFAMLISAYGEMFNEVRDYEGDHRAGVRHTASVLGPRWARRLMVGFMMVAVAAGLAGLLALGLIPGWVLALMGGIAVLLAVRPLWRSYRGRAAFMAHASSVHKPLEVAAACALAAQVALPWAVAVMQSSLLASWLRW